ncbi:ribonucleotide reductase [Mycena rebaudengoi]|nr:ribonucleotide reductase [Mycena rebaudengoi]
MLVRKRGRLELYHSQKLFKRLETATFKIDPTQIDITRLVDEVYADVRTGFSTDHIDELAIQAALRATYINPDYARLASHIEVSRMHKNINPKFSDSISLRNASETRPFSAEFLDVIERHRNLLDEAVIHLRDYDYSHERISDILQQLLARDGSRVIERIQHMYMRMALTLHLSDIPNVLRTYELISGRYAVHDSFTSMSTDSIHKNLSSAYAVDFSNMDIQTMYDTISKCAFIVRAGARVSILAQGVPCNGRDSSCKHDHRGVGLWEILRMMDGALAFLHRLDDKRADTVNICIEPWHKQVRSVIEFNNMHQHDLSDQKSVTVTLSIPDIFMARVDADGPWSLFCPHLVPGLKGLYGTAFDDAYTEYEESTIPRTSLRARTLWNSILRSQILTGGPCIFFKDSATAKSNQITVDSSTQSPRPTEATLPYIDGQLSPQSNASIALPLFVTASLFDFRHLHRITKEVVNNMNIILDSLFASSTPHPNKEYRAIAIGVHGLANVFTALRIPYDSAEAGQLNIEIAETMYHAALEASCDLAEAHGPYAKFSESPLAGGTLQFDMWTTDPSDAFDWPSLRARIRTFGVRNSALLAVGPTLPFEWMSEFTESVHPSQSNLMSTNVVRPSLVGELIKIGVWDEELRQAIISGEGSVQQIDRIPSDIKALYRTAWEIDPQVIFRMATDRAPYICSSQSILLHLDSPTPQRLGELLMRAWSMGLKTGLHKLRTRFYGRSAGTSSLEDDSDREMSYEDVVLSSIN